MRNAHRGFVIAIRQKAREAGTSSMKFFSPSWSALLLRTVLVSTPLAVGGCRSPSIPNDLPFGVMDVPRNGEGLRGTVQLVGWALAESGIKQVIVYVDRHYAATAKLGLNP